MILLSLNKSNVFILENVYFNPEEKHTNSIFTGDTATLLCPVNSSKGDVRWSYTNNKNDRHILSIGRKLNTADFPFQIAYTDHLKEVIYLRICNITWEQQRIFKCYYSFQNSHLEYKYTLQLASK